jgi:hypothetical protein
VALVSDDLCPCGVPVDAHGRDRRQLAIVRRHILERGPLVVVVSADGKWLVPRIWIALHGIVGAELPALAERFGWSPAPPSRRNPST